MAHRSRSWQPFRALTRSQKLAAMVLSVALPLGVWAAVSYVPWIWHPLVLVEDAGGSTILQTGDRVERAVFDGENQSLRSQNLSAARGKPANPVFLPAPHEVAEAFVTAFTTPPRRTDDLWLHESLGRSLQVILWGFILSSLIGVPLGILVGAYGWVRGTVWPFVEFFRYLPAPAFGALCVAVLGIADAPKIAIIFIGTFFQQVLVIANTTAKADRTLVEAAQTLGVRGPRLLTQSVLPGILPDLWKDQRILLGWAWTYLIVAEVVGSSSGITYFINQQAKYRIYDHVYAAIAMIGLLGLAMDFCLAWLGRRLFPWHRVQTQQET